MSFPVFGVIAPHPPILVPSVGGREALVAHASLDALRDAGRALASFAPETIVLISPHAPLMQDAFLIDDSESIGGSLAQFGAPEAYRWRGDPDLASALVQGLETADIPAIARSTETRLKPGWLDHGAIVPLSFLDPQSTCALVVLSLSYLPYALHRQLGSEVRRAAEAIDRRVAFIASGDMSHRLSPEAAAGYSPQGARLDAAIREHVSAGLLSELMTLDADMVEQGGECGLRSIIALGGYCGPDPVPSRVLSYEGPWGVGYLTALSGKAAVDRVVPAKGRKGGTPGHDASEIVRLARAAIAAYVHDGTTITNPPVLSDPGYPERAGCFVSLHRSGGLRGCIGTIAPTRSTLAGEVVGNALEAATRDPRFAPLSATELTDLEIKVDVLQPPESCTSADLDPATYGVIVTSGMRRGLLLPDLEGVDSVADQIAIAMNKAGIRPGTQCDLQRFTVDRYN
ncbi:MAG: AmmeMemoRadiSam system protein A [Coriobacteriia bacterium]|nr:AmmeMemoRadiSam system protein A [Coriobacteriia bacterium]